MSRYILTRDELNTFGCEMPGCDHDHSVLFLKQACHPQAGATVSYHKKLGTILIACVECDGPVAEILVGNAS